MNNEQPMDKSAHKIAVKQGGHSQVSFMVVWRSVLFNDDTEHRFQILCYMSSLPRSSLIPDDAADKQITSFCEASKEYASLEWKLAKEVINFFPSTFFMILEEVFPLIASSVKSAGVNSSRSKRLAEILLLES